MRSISEKISLLPVSNGSRYYKPFTTKIAIIADKDVFDFYEHSAQITYITPSNWQLSVGKVDILLITTAKQGLNGEWLGIRNPQNEKRILLSQVITGYRTHGAKVVFYSKEYNGDYKAFLELAKLCDYIFTAAAKRVKDYQTACEHDRVYPLRFGVNPNRHNPVGFKNDAKIPGVVFSGSWNKQFIEQMSDIEMISAGIVEANQKLNIAEDYFLLQNANYYFTDRHFKHIFDVEKEDLSAIHKLFDWALNINASTYKHLFSDYVYALQASGNVVISNYNTGINNLFPHVFIVTGKEEVGNIMSSFDEEELYEQQILGIRKVMTNDTNYQRMYEMLKAINTEVEEQVRTVAVIVEDDNANIQKQFLEQSYPHKELLQAAEISDDIINEYDFITYFNDESNYGTYYLEDMLNAFKYTDVDFVTKKAYFLNGKLQAGVEHDYVRGYEEKARTVFSTRKFTTLSDLDIKEGLGYAVDHFEFSVGKYEKFVPTKQSYKLSVIIPVFNNGECLRHKAFNSLRRSTMFHEMEIVIVDDGSSDQLTLSTIKRLAQKYDNVKTYFYPVGGSGSASRPRNKGVRLSTTDYIAYLDPDDEMINDGFTTLYKEIISSDYCMVIGNGIAATNTRVYVIDQYMQGKKANNGADIIIDPHRFLVKTNLKPMHIMSLVVKKEVILKNNLTMIEGAFGEDTLFYHEIVLNAKRIKLVNKLNFLYYRTIENSATNKISTVLFEKYLLREQEAKKKYTEYGILDDYLTRRYERFFLTWYFPKLRQTLVEDLVAAIKVVKAMIDLHASYYELKDEDMIRFYKLAKKEDYKKLREFFASYTSIKSTNSYPITNINEADEKLAARQQLQVFKEKVNASFLLDIEEKIRELPSSNGSRYYEPFKVKIAIIADEYIYEHCKDTAQFIYVTPDNYKDNVGKVDVFLITNAHKGLAGEWKGMEDPKSLQRSALKRMITEYRKAGAKVIYCATSESPNGKMLEGIGKKCDYIFTTSAEKVAAYKKKCKTDKVYVLKWGVNPLIHNPIGCRQFGKYSRVIFAKSRLDAYPKMTVEERKPFDGVIVSDYDLTIVKQDVEVLRQELELKSSEDFFPDQYRFYMLDKVKGEALLKMYKLYDWAICVNKADSQTIAHGVYEMQAMGNLVFSNDSAMVRNMFPGVFVIEDEIQVQEIMERFTEEELYQRKMMGVRRVMSRDTVYHHLCKLLCTVGLDVELPVKKVAVVVEEVSEKMQVMFYMQSYPDKELVLVQDLGDEVLGEFDFIAYFREDAVYGACYLEDMINAFKYVDVGFVTKMSGVEHEFVAGFEDKWKTVFSTRDLRSLSELGDVVGVGYAVDRFEVEMLRC